MYNNQGGYLQQQTHVRKVKPHICSEMLPSQLYLLLPIVDWLTQGSTSEVSRAHRRRAMNKTKQNKNASKAVFEEKKGGQLKVYLDVRLLGLYYCEDDLCHTKKTKFHRMSHWHKAACSQPLEESHYSGNYTAQHRLRGKLKTISRSLLTGRIRKSICGWFLKTEDGVTVTFVNM